MAELFLPTLHTFAMNNIFTGSKGLFRFRAEPKVVMANPERGGFRPERHPCGVLARPLLL